MLVYFYIFREQNDNCISSKKILTLKLKNINISLQTIQLYAEFFFSEWDIFLDSVETYVSFIYVSKENNVLKNSFKTKANGGKKWIFVTKTKKKIGMKYENNELYTHTGFQIPHS